MLETKTQWISCNYLCSYILSIISEEQLHRIQWAISLYITIFKEIKRWPQERTKPTRKLWQFNCHIDWTKYYDQFWKDKSSQTGKLFIMNNLENHKNKKKKRKIWLKRLDCFEYKSKFTVFIRGKRFKKNRGGPGELILSWKPTELRVHWWRPLWILQPRSSTNHGSP